MSDITLAEINLFHAEKMGGNQFAPSDGVCFRCHANIYDTPKLREQALKEARTGCPYCHYSFVE